MIIPAELSARARRIWAAVEEEYELIPAFHYPLLTAALTAFDEMITARKRVKKEGARVRTPTGFYKANIYVKIEHDAAVRFVNAWSRLGLDTEPTGEVGRPPDANKEMLNWGQGEGRPSDERTQRLG